jgi:hypothetical protein
MSVNAGSVQNKNYILPTALPEQINARNFRASAKEQRAEQQHKDTLEQFRRQIPTANQKSGSGRAGDQSASCSVNALQNSVGQRLDQVRAKDELYTQVRSPKETQPALPLTLAPNSQRMEAVQVRPDTMTRRAMNQVDAQVSMDKAMNRTSAVVASGLLREAAQRNGSNPGVSTLQSEKERYESEYRQGNELAYAHVDALQRSIRGYADTGDVAMAQVKQWNEREAARAGAAVFSTPAVPNNTAGQVAAARKARPTFYEE